MCNFAGFTESDANLAVKKSSVGDTDGTMPWTQGSEGDMTLTFCCRQKGQQDIVTDAPYSAPFYLIKVLYDIYG